MLSNLQHKTSLTVPCQVGGVLCEYILWSAGQRLLHQPGGFWEGNGGVRVRVDVLLPVQTPTRIADTGGIESICTWSPTRCVVR